MGKRCIICQNIVDLQLKLNLITIDLWKDGIF